MQDSPPTTNPRNVGRSRSGMEASIDATTSVCVIALPLISAARSSPAARASGGGTTSVAPASSAIAISAIDTSKLIDTTNRNRLDASRPSRSMWVAATLPIPRWVTATPLGLPVDPEV